MASLEELRQERLKKLNILKEKGIDPYPAATASDHTCASVLADFDALSTSKTEVTIAGRIMAQRGQGALLFLDIFDGTARIQGLLKKGEISDEAFLLFQETVDVGDFVELKGVPFVTQRGEKTLAVLSWNMLSKSLQPLPDKWHGLTDEETRYRKRYLDILMNEELQEMLRKKSLFWDTVRSFMKEKGFLEVETPTLEVTTGGAEARPFVMHHNDFDMEVFLRISIGELWQKRLMASGFPKTFEIGKAYRNEGSSPEHLQEFTNLEFYWAYADYNNGMELVQELYRTIATKVFGTTVFTQRGHTFDLNDEWVRVDYVTEVKRQTGIDILSATEEEMKAKLEELKVTYEGANKERLIDTLWKYCRKNIAGPAFLINHPKIVAPLAKAQKDNPNVVQMFQPILAGSEVGRGYSELNDPIDQKERFEIQKKLIEGGDEEAMMPDWEFVEMLEHGMPPTCGFGFGERLFSFMMGKTIRECQAFPLMRPKD